MPKLILIDGNLLLWRMFRGIPARIRAHDGKLLHAVVGFIGATLRYIRTLSPKYFLVIFDNENQGERYSLSAEYKQNRMLDFSDVPDEEHPFGQLDIIKAILDVLGLKHCEIEGVEADDVIASYVRSHKTISSYIISSDADLLQLVTHKVSLFVDRGKQSVIYDPDKVLEKYQVKPKQILDFKALVGDKSDNIAGLPGVGPKTAAKLINEYGSLKRLIKSYRRITPQSLSDKIGNHLTRLEENYALIKLNDQVDLPFSLADLKIDAASFAKLKTMDILRKEGYI